MKNLYLFLNLLVNYWFLGPFSNTFCTYKQDYDKILAFTDDVTGLKERREKKKNPVDEQDAKKAGKKGKKWFIYI